MLTVDAQPWAICNYTSLDLTEKYVQILYFQDPTITSVIQNSIIELQLVRMILKRQLLLSDSADDRPILLTLYHTSSNTLKFTTHLMLP